MVEAETGTHIWAERYDRLLDDIFAVQDELTMSVVGAIEPNLRKAEIERVRRKRPDNLHAYDLVLRALPLLYSAMPATMESAIPLLEKAIEIESGYARAHADLAWCLHHRFSRGDHREEDRQAAIGHANAAIAGARDDATALAIAAFVISLDARDNARALELFDRALALSNSNIFALSCSAVILAWSGHTGLAIERASRALRLSPFDPLNDRSFNAISIACFHERRFEDAADAARRAIECNPGFSVPHLLLSAALLRLGRGAEARAVAQHGRKLQSNFTIRSFESTVGFAADVFSGFAKAWADAGLPE